MKRIFPYIVLVTLTIAISVLNTGYVSAASINDLENKINEMEKQEGQLKDEQNNLNSDKQQADDKIDKNVNKQNIVKQDINTIDGKLSVTQSSIQIKETEIATTNNEIEELSERIAALKEDIEDLKDRIKKRDILLKDRLLAIQKNGGSVKYMEVIFGSQSFGDFISRAFAVNTIMDQDKTIMEEHAADKESLEDKQTEVEGKREAVEEQKVALEGQKSELLSLKSQLDKQMTEKETLMGKLEEEHEELEEYKMSVEEEQGVLSAQARIIEQAKKEAVQEKGKLEQLAEEKRKQEEAAVAATNKVGKTPGYQPPSDSLNAGGSGVLNWPASGRLSSPFGYRSFNGGGFHYGLDISAPQGTFVGAAASGVVTRADRSPSYGNVVYIYHPALNMTTVYAHLHTISVSLGGQVGAGQGIGTVGNTGDSYGAHLHFETHHGGWSQHNGVNPMQYLK